MAILKQWSNSNMTFKNINTAINQELGRIAGVQHHAAGTRNTVKGEGRSIYDKPLEFEIWFNRGLRYYETVKGFKFQWLNLTTLKVTLPNGRTGTRSLEDFEEEYEHDYKRQFPSCH